MPKLRVALISGGTSAEREVSLKSGQTVAQHLDAAKYAVTHYDPARDLPKLVKDALGQKLDVAFIILHGRGGEDGTIQGLLELLKVPYTGSGVYASSTAIDKNRSKQLYRQAKLAVARDVIVQRGQPDTEIQVAVAQLAPPYFVKPNREGSSIGAGIAHTRDQALVAARKALEFDETALIEEFIEGTEVTGSVLGNRQAEALPLVEVVLAPEKSFFNFDAKYDGSTDEICPARLDPELTRLAQAVALRAHHVFGCRGLSRTDMILPHDPSKHDDARVIIMETNTLPGMTTESFFPKAARAHGLEFSALLDKLIALALEDQK